jgi:UDP-GlcNAc:undecaprenyl-phosphate GlcNAc-1-phosphate transferase
MSFASSALTTLMFSLALGTCLTFAILHLASRLPWLARESANRLHVAPTPVWGGIAIFFSFMSVASTRGLFSSRELMVAAISACGVFLLGLADDVWRLPPRWKLLGQFVCALTPAALVLRHPLTGSWLVDMAIAIFWIVGLTNAFNLLDNINGLSAGTAVLATGFQTVLFLNQGELARALISIAFGGAVMGFLIFNFPRGRIFMGDCGSLFVGFWLAAASLSSTHSFANHQLGSALFPLLVMVVPICDTTLVTLTRMLRGRPISVGGTDHLSHRLMAYGLSQKSAVLTLWTFSLLSGTLGFFAVSYGFSPFLSAAALLLVAIALFGVYITRYELRMQLALPEEAIRTPKVAPWVRVCSRVLLDLILIVTAYYTAYLLRFDGRISQADMQLLVSTTTELVLIKLCVFVAFGAYRPSWDYFGLKDAYFFVGASALASIVAVSYFSAVYRFYGFSRIVIALDFLVFTFLTLLSRFSFRLFDELAPANHRTNVLIYGADGLGETALHVVSKHYRFRVVGFLDDDHAEKNFSIHSIPVRGCSQDLVCLAERWDVQIVLLTASTSAEAKNRLSALCSALGIKLLSLEHTLVDLTTTANSSSPEVSANRELLADKIPYHSVKALTKASSSS